MRVLFAQVNPTVGDLKGNAEKVLQGIAQARNQSANLVLFPELCLSGYPPEDFLLLPHFVKAIDGYLHKIIEASSDLVVVLGLPRRTPEQKEKPLFNSAAVISDRKLLGFHDKILLPTYDVFDERRYFESGEEAKVWELLGKKVAITICEDIWQHGSSIMYTRYHRDPIAELKSRNPEILINISASPFSLNKPKKRLEVCSHSAKTLGCPLLLCNQVGGNDSLIFDGYSLYLGKNGELLQLAKGFQEDFMLVDLTKRMSPNHLEAQATKDLYEALVLGLRDYFRKSGFSQACLGLSGGIDSAVVAGVATEALGKENVLAISMPSRYSSASSQEDAAKLAKSLGIDFQTISIERPFQSYLELLAPSFAGKAPDITEENLQARIRGVILMAISNKFGHIVLSTGNKSELAMGYATLYGDMCGGLGIISDVTKAQVYALAHWINRKEEMIPLRIISRPPSAELRPNQKDSDSLPDYEIIDTVVEGYVESHLSPEDITKKYHYPQELVNDIVKRIHRNEYKRRQSPPGLRVTEKAFSVGRRFPIVQKWA